MSYFDSGPNYGTNPGYGAAPGLQTQLAGFWIRAGASLIDGLILIIPSLILTLLTKNSFISGIVLDGIFCIGFWVANGGRTPGDMATGLQVVREDGSPINLGVGLVRYIMLVVGEYALLLGVLWVIWDAKKQGWHDKAAGTLVIRV